jgi:3',5'-cyclic AMP phosphodiesterase CpdA
MGQSDMRVAHFTDIHFQVTPKLSELLAVKRLMGSTNLYILGREQKFNSEVQLAAIQQIVDWKPDLVLITGDISAQALDAEFEMAREKLDPILSRFPTVIQAGNHDTYITKAPPPKMKELFGEWMLEDGAGFKQFGSVGVLCVESCRANLLSQGFVAPSSLEKATQLLENQTAEFVFFCMHYPILGRKGEVYGPTTRAIKNIPDVLAWLKKTEGVHAFLHGHEHHGYQTELELRTGKIPSINPGSGGYAVDVKKDRRAHVALYTVEGSSISHIERRRFLDGIFVEEPNGAFATGR